VAPLLAGDNLRVSPFTRATKILFDDDKKAVAVEAVMHNRRVVFMAKKEIVLCAGAIGSPHLLQLSGVGQREELLAAGVQRVVHDLPSVGRGLKDHVFVPFDLFNRGQYGRVGPSRWAAVNPLVYVE